MADLQEPSPVDTQRQDDRRPCDAVALKTALACSVEGVAAAPAGPTEAVGTAPAGSVDAVDTAPTCLAEAGEAGLVGAAHGVETASVEPAETVSKDATVAFVQVRLSADRMRLEVCLAPETRRASRDELARALSAQCRPLTLKPEMTPERALDCLRVARVGQWATVVEGTRTSAPVNGSITFVTHPPAPAATQWFHPRVPIRKGETILRIDPGRDGEAGVDLCGTESPAPSARQPAVPAGENTILDEDEYGPALLAACDGEVSVDHLTVAVQSARLVSARELVRQPSLSVDGAVFVIDSVPPRSEVIASGNIFVAGDVDAATLVSRQGSITVLGCVTGYHTRHCTIQAAGDINLASVLHADVITPANIRLQTQARNATLTAGGQLYLLSRLRTALYDVEARIAGAVIPIDQPNVPPDVPETERNTFLIPCAIAGMVALYDPVSVAFRPCHIVELSLASARVQVSTTEADQGLPANRVVLLKFALPELASPLQILGRTMQTPARGVTSVMFRQLSHQDEAHLTAYCLALLRAQSVPAYDADEAILPAAADVETPEGER